MADERRRQFSDVLARTWLRDVSDIRPISTHKQHLFARADNNRTRVNIKTVMTMMVTVGCIQLQESKLNLTNDAK